MSSFVHNIPWSEEEITILTPKIFETNLGFESLNREQVSNSGGVLLLTFPQKLAGPYLQWWPFENQQSPLYVVK